MPRRLNFLGLVVSVVALAGVVWWATRQKAPKLPDTRGELLWLAAAVGIYGLNTLLRAARWHRLVEHDGGRPARADSAAITTIGYAVNNVLPARAGDAVRVVLMAPRAGVTRRTVVGTLLAERLLDILVVVLLFVVIGYGILGDASNGDLIVVAIATVVLAGGLAVAVLLVRRNARIHALVQPMLTSTLALRSRHGTAMLALTVLIWVVETFVWMAVGASAGLDMSLLEGLYLVGLASVFALIPSGPAYAGTQDTAAVVGIKAIGGTSQLALSYLLVLRFVLVVPITLAGFGLLAARYGGIARLRRARIESAAADAPTAL